MGKLHSLLLLLIVGAAGASAWAFTRPSSEEALAGWRAAEQLVQTRAWAPAVFETSPLWGVVELVPPLVGLSPVVFVKLVSLALLWAFLRWFSRAARGSWLPAFALVAVPATLLQAFGGSEHFLFAVLLSALFVALQRESARHAVVLALVLFCTRPEAWLLVALVPLFFFLEPPQWMAVEIPKAPRLYAKNVGLGWERALGLFAALAVPLLGLLALRPLLFGALLPAQPVVSLHLLPYLAPLIALAALGHGRLALVMGLCLGNIALTVPGEAGALLVVLPQFVVLAVTSVKTKGSWIFGGRVLRRASLAQLTAALLLVVFAAQTFSLERAQPWLG